MGKKKEKDFKKVKLKVGKKAPVKENDTRTTFKSQAIVVPEQSISENKGEPTTARNQTLKELLAHAKHYNPNMRKDAIYGIRELLLRNPNTILQHLSSVFESLFSAIMDDDQNVRHAFLAFLTTLTPQLTKNNVAPFISLFLSYCTSAMTHIFDDIRLDSLDFINLWMNSFPSLIVGSTIPVLPNYLGLLTHFENKGIQSKSSGSSVSSASKLLSNPSGKFGSSKSRISVLTSFLSYLQKATHFDLPRTWFEHVHSLKDDLRAEQPYVAHWKREKELEAHLISRAPFLDHPPMDLFENFEQKVQQDKEKDSNKPATTSNVNLKNLVQFESFVQTMMEILMECWIESAPGISTEFVSANGQSMRTTLHLVLKIQLLLWNHHAILLRKTPNPKPEQINFLHGFTKDLHKHYFIHFPFGDRVLAKRDQKTLENLKEMNILFCQLVSLTIPSFNGKVNKDWRGEVFNYLTEIFESQEKTTVTLTTENFEELLPVVWRYLRGSPVSQQEVMFQALVHYGETLPSASNSKRLFFEFLSKNLIHGGPHYQNCKGKLGELLKDWLLSLPKLLWEIGDRNQSTARMILEQLLFLAKKKHGEFQAIFATVQLSLIPFFFVSVPSKNENEPEKRIFGPFVKLSPPTQKLAIELVYYFDHFPERMVLALSNCANAKILEPENVRTILQILSLKQSLFGDNSPSYLRFLFSLLFGYPREDLEGISLLHSQSFSTKVIASKTIISYFGNALEGKGKRKSDVLEGDEESIFFIRLRTFWKRRISILEELFHSISSLKICSPEEFLLLIERPLCTILEEFIPIDFGVSLLRFLSFLKLKEVPQTLLSLITSLPLMILLQAQNDNKCGFNEFGLIFEAIQEFFLAYPFALKTFVTSIAHELQEKEWESKPISSFILIISKLVAQGALVKIIEADLNMKEAILQIHKSLNDNQELISSSKNEVGRLLLDIQLLFIKTQ